MSRRPSSIWGIPRVLRGRASSSDQEGEAGQLNLQSLGSIRLPGEFFEEVQLAYQAGSWSPADSTHSPGSLTCLCSLALPTVSP